MLNFFTNPHELLSSLSVLNDLLYSDESVLRTI